MKKVIMCIFLMIISLSFLGSCSFYVEGTSLLTGNGQPSNVIGKEGDSYIDLESWDYYIKTNDIWSLAGNIKGEEGSSNLTDYEGTEGLAFYPINNTECGVSVGNAKLMKEIIVPSTYKNYAITSMCCFYVDGALIDGGFQGCPYLEKISLPESIKIINDNAFAYCSSLKEIKFSSSLEYIGSGAFRDCITLKEIVIPSSVTYIGRHAFSDCENLIIYCQAELQPSEWHQNWNSSNRPVYWAGQWEYDSNGNPVPLN